MDLDINNPKTTEMQLKVIDLIRNTMNELPPIGKSAMLVYNALMNVVCVHLCATCNAINMSQEDFGRFTNDTLGVAKKVFTEHYAKLLRYKNDNR